MGTIKSYTKKNGQKAWQFQTYLCTDEVTGKQKYTTRRGFATKKECTLALNKLLLDIEENGFSNTRIVTFKQLYDDWLPVYRKKVKPSTVAATIDVFKLYILPHFGNMRLQKISVSYCQSVLNTWHDSFRGYKGFRMKTNLLLDYAVALELLTSNPMSKTQIPRQKEKDSPKNFYTKQQLQDFLSLYKSEGDPMKYVFFHLLAYTGLRKSEALALRYSDINFLKHELTVGRTVAVNEASDIIIQTPKTANSYRTISIDPVTMNLLESWQKQQREFYFKLGYNTSKPDQLLFTTIDNKTIRPSFVNGWLRNFYKRHQDMPKITAHGFRFTHCSLLFEAGASMKEVQGRLGHKDVQTTMNIYAKVTPAMATNTGDKFAQFMAN